MKTPGLRPRRTAELTVIEGGASANDRRHSSGSTLRLPLQLANALNTAASQDDIARFVTDCLEQHFPTGRVRFMSAARSRSSPGDRADVPASFVDALWPAGTTTIEREGQTWVGVPLRCRDGLHGHLVIEFQDDPSLSDDDRAMLELVASMAAGECARLRIHHAFDRHVSDLTFIQELDRKLSRARDITSMFETVTEQLRSVVDSTMCSVLVADDESGILRVVGNWHGPHPSHVGFEVPIDASRSGTVYRSRKPVLIPDVLADASAWGKAQATWRSLMIVPLTSGAHTFGTLHVAHDQPYVYDARDLRMVELIATQIATAIYRVVEAEREQKLHLAAIEALSAAVDARDPFTHTHSRRVADLARRIAARMGMSEEEVDQIELAGLLHDIGKIGIPDRILTKPGRLDPEERLIMMSHSEMGAQIIGRHPALADLVPIVRHHHEWHDGRGYPGGLRGDAIPRSAAIMGVADAFETMTSNRVYRRALSVDEARQELARGRGGQFQPDAVDALLDLLDRDPEVRALFETAGGITGVTDGTGSLAPIQVSDIVALRVLTRIAAEIGALTEIDTFLDHVHAIVRNELDLHNVIIWLYDPDRNDFVLAAGEAELPAPRRLRPASPEPEFAVSDCDEKMQIMTRDGDDGVADQTVICPMYVEDSLVGLIELVPHSAGQLDSRDMDLMRAIAAPVAPTVRVAQLHDQAKHAALTDGLTGVLNHRAFYERLDLDIESLAQGEQIHLLIVDVIGLKAINDNYGHIAGDQILRTVADAMVSRLRRADVVARYGGDEFAAILRGPLDAPIETIVERIEAPVPCDLGGDTQLKLRLRCGYATTGRQDGRATELVARADALLYRHSRPTLRASGD